MARQSDARDVDIAGSALMGADAPPTHFTQPAGFAVSLSMDKHEAAERIFQALAKGGKVQMPIQKTFWAARFGMLIDQFGIPWMVNCGTRGRSVLSLEVRADRPSWPGGVAAAVKKSRASHLNAADGVVAQD